MSDYLIGGPNELDLSQLGTPHSNELPIAEARKVVKLDNLSESELFRLLEMADQLESAKKHGGFRNWFVPGTKFGIENLPKHSAFFRASKDYHELYFSAANQTGKTTSACFAMTLHLTGLYPDWWPGRRWRTPVQAWAAGSTVDKTRDIIQKELVGDVGSFGTGMIPKDLIIRTGSKSGASNALDMIQVRHVTGGVSTLRFKAYKQEREAFEGEKIDIVWLDEMPDTEIYSECYTRTITRSGIVMVTATPLDGMTPLVLSFYSQADFLPEGQDLPFVITTAKDDFQKKIEDAVKKGESIPEMSGGKSKAVIIAGWDDAPWLTQEARDRVLAACPPHLRQARSTGIPGDAGGMVFPIPLGEVLVDDFPIPSHYRLINGLDPGWNNTAALFAALDPDTDTLYIYGDYKRGQAEPIIHAEAIKSKSKWKDAPCLIDPAGLGRSQLDGKQAIQLYKQHGLKLIIAENSVEAGIAMMWERLSTGKMKIFRSCKEFQREYVTYQRDEKGNIVKENDHCLDVGRYICMGVKHARTPLMAKGQSQFTGLNGNVSGKKYF